MGYSQTTVGLVQIGELIWDRRPSKQFHLVDGALRPKPIPPNWNQASLAYLPHSVSLLESYAKEHASNPGTLNFLLPLYKRLPVAQAAAHLSSADVVGFSTYVWNIRYSLALARDLKRSRPGVLVVFGGPQVPEHAEAFLRTHPFVDLVCHGEGERTFCDILERPKGRAWQGVASISYLDAGGKFAANHLRPRLSDLDEVPSPMLDGTYEKLIRSAPDQEWLATWETNRGCPFACTFCDWGSATASKISRYGEARLRLEIEWMADHHINHLCVCDANFGILPRDVEVARNIAQVYAERRAPLAISIQNTKNRTDRSEQIQRVFRESGVVSFGASISLQSVDPSVLKAIRRENISLAAFERLQRHYAEQNLDTYSDLIIGLPGETYQSFTEGVSRVIQNGQFNRVAFYECFVLPNAPMNRPEYRQQFAIETVPIRMIHFHEPLDRADGEDPEFIDMVVSTSSMTREDWIRARVFAHFVELLFFDRLLHVPMLILGAGFGADYRQMFEGFMKADPSQFEVIGRIRRTFEAHACSMVNGGPQYIASSKWLNLYWPVDQYALIDLAEGSLLDDFYDEAQLVLEGCMEGHEIEVHGTIIKEAVALNRAMFAVPFQLCDELLETRYPVAQAYQAALGAGSVQLRPSPTTCRIERTRIIWMSWTDWCEDLVRRLFLRKNYLYPVTVLNETGGPAASRASSKERPLASSVSP